MALDIGIGNGSSFCPVQNEPSFQLDDGYYWFLLPFLEELAKRTGHYIDLYGDASFTGMDLTAMEEMLNRLAELIGHQPARWNVAIGWGLVPHDKGTQTRPHLNETFATVEKARFISLLGQWQGVVTRAKELDRPVVCFGD